ncbi:MAG: S46 family peptidase [Flavobacteriales bacterium]
MNKKIILFLLLISGAIAYSQKDGGMWQPQKLEANKQEMRKLGSKLKPSDIYNEKKASIKDAIVHFNRGCTAEIISPKALLLTNHHCGYSQIQAHSTIENDLLKNGFWAKNNTEELKNEKLTATLIVSIKDVTDEVLKVPGSLLEDEREEVIKQNIQKIQKRIKKEPWQDVEIKSFYKGNEYYAFVTETFRDVRLVGAPPQSIGKFGSDTDNWMWPRHTGDFSLFRIYADKNNKPAEYSKDNVPYNPKHFLPINIKGVKEGDFTMVYGFPGRTDEYLPASAIKQTLEVINPARIKIRETALNILDKEMRKDDATRIKYASKYASTANYWKKWKGENLGLKKSNAIHKKEKYEADYLERVKDNYEYKNVLSEMSVLYKEIEPYALTKVYVDEIISRNSESFKIALKLNKLLIVKERLSEQEYEKEKKEIEAYLKRFYKNYNGTLDLDVTKALYSLYIKNVPKRLQPKTISQEFRIEDYSQSIIPTNQVLPLFKESDEMLISALSSDPIVRLVNQLAINYYLNSEREYKILKEELNPLQRKYMKAQKEVMTERRFYPDANSTLRVTYGQVQGYQPEKGKHYEPKTYLSGVMKKYIPGDYEFDVSKKLQELYAKKDYGQYADKKGRMPINFIATNHTTGGNSGSPALDAKGNLIGLNFDRVWEGTMSDLNYDPEICRNIMVDVRYILFIIDKYAEAGYLMDEMKLVR